MKDLKMGLCAVCVFMALGWAFTANYTVMTSVFAPKQEQIRRETFEQSKAYRQGMIQELQNMQFQYIQADDQHKKGLAAIIKHRAADVPSDVLPNDLREFVEGL